MAISRRPSKDFLNPLIEAVRWPVWDDVFAEGLLLEPDRLPVARAVAVPDADWSPEALAGLTSDIPAAAQFPRRLAESAARCWCQW